MRTHEKYLVEEYKIDNFVKALEKAGVLRKNSVGFYHDYDLEGVGNFPDKIEDL